MFLVSRDCKTLGNEVYKGLHSYFNTKRNRGRRSERRKIILQVNSDRVQRVYIFLRLQENSDIFEVQPKHIRTLQNFDDLTLRSDLMSTKDHDPRLFCSHLNVMNRLIF